MRGPPSKSGCLVLWASVAFVLKNETNLSVTSSGMHRCANDDTTAIHPFAATQPDLFAVCHNQKNLKVFKITDINFPVFKRNGSAGSYRVSPRSQRRDSYPVTLECNNDAALWLALTVFFATVAK